MPLAPFSRLRPVLCTRVWAVLASLLFAVAFPSPLSASGTPPATSTVEEDNWSVQIKKIFDILNPDAKGKKLDGATTDMAKMAVLLIKDSMLWSQKVHEALRGEAAEIASTLLWAVLFAEITFAGFRLMLGSSIIEQLGLLTTKTFIYLIVSGTVVFPGAPAPYNTAEGIIRGAMFRMMHAGKFLGSELIKNASHPNVQSLSGIKEMQVEKSAIPSSMGFSGMGPDPAGGPLTGEDALGRPYRRLGGQGYGDAGSFGPNLGGTGGSTIAPAARAEPMMYWLSWIGVEYATLYAPGPTGQPDYPKTTSELKKRLLEEEYKFSQLSLNVRIWGENPLTGDTVSEKLAKNSEIAMDEFRRQQDQDADPSQKSSWSDTATGVLMGTMPLQMFGIALSVAGVQIAALITVVFAQISMLVGSITAFNIAASMGLAVLPLMYFKMFDKIWSQYLISLGSLALIPFLFYLLSAIGFIFSTTIFEQLFPLPQAIAGRAGAETPSLALILNQMFFAAVETTMTSFGLVLSGFGQALIFLLSSMISIYVTLGRIMFGCTIVASFISAGALFSLLAPRFAFRWQQGFGAEDVMEKIGEIFNNIQSAVGSGMGQMYSDAISKGGQMGKGLMSGMGGPK